MPCSACQIGPSVSHSDDQRATLPSAWVHDRLFASSRQSQRYRGFYGIHEWAHPVGFFWGGGALCMGTTCDAPAVSGETDQSAVDPGTGASIFFGGREAPQREDAEA
jgi:hypothetical protein